MLKRLRKRRERNASTDGDTVFLFVDINERCRPDARDAVYADPLGEALARAGLGEVTGAGTMISPEGEPLSSGIDIETVNRAAAEELVVGYLNHVGVPKGTFIVGGDPSVQSPRFGVSEGVGIYLNGSELPHEVYAESDVNVVMDDLATSMGGAGELRSWWEGPGETALYLYGPSAGAIRTTVDPVLSRHRLCEGARLVDLPTREHE